MFEVKKRLKYLILFVFVVILVTLIVLFTPALWNHWVSYPRLEKEINELQKLRKEPAALTRLNTYRGLMHAHSYLSHDSRGTLYDIIPAAKINGIDFVFLTDHPRGNIDTIPKGYNGFYDGVLIEPGSEKQGFDCWPIDSTIIDWRVDKDTIAKNIPPIPSYSIPHFNISTDTKVLLFLPAQAMEKLLQLNNYLIKLGFLILIYRSNSTGNL